MCRLDLIKVCFCSLFIYYLWSSVWKVHLQRWLITTLQRYKAGALLLPHSLLQRFDCRPVLLLCCCVAGCRDGSAPWSLSELHWQQPGPKVSSGGCYTREGELSYSSNYAKATQSRKFASARHVYDYVYVRCVCASFNAAASTTTETG